MANTTTSVVQVTVNDESGKTKTFNIDNPKQNLSLNEIRQALEPAFNGRWWLGNGGAVITTLKSANYSIAEKIPIAGSDIVITVTPNEITLGNSASNVTVTVEGSPVTGAFINNIVTSAPNLQLYVSKTTENTVKVFGDNTAGTDASGTTATLNIITEAKTVTIPITFL